MTTLFVNRLTAIDCCYLCPTRGLVGETWLVDVELDGDLDHQGMVLDFGEVKRSIKQAVDEAFDHKLLVPAQYPDLLVAEYPEGQHIAFTLEDGREIQHRAPHDAVRLLPCERVVTDQLARLVGDHLAPRLPGNVSDVRVRLSVEPIDGAHYHYSHGLRQHAGNCQRIAHGHRSRLIIERNGQRDPDLELSWAEQWTDIYIGTRGDLIGSSQRDGNAYYEFGYRSTQGRFGLTLPISACYLIDTDSTIENIAQHIAQSLHAVYPSDHFRILAYEGVDKGAIGRAAGELGR